MNLFAPVVPRSKQHQIFQMLLDQRYATERAVVSDMAKGFRDRDGKFVREFQATFESSFWELYLNGAAATWGLTIDRAYASPDFVVTSPTALCIEATICAPASGGKPPIGYGVSDIPEDFTDFNMQASLRISNSFVSKVRRYREYYRSLAQVSDVPFVIAIGAFDRPLAHFAASRPILAALYGLYYDEAATSPDADKVVSYNISAVAKSETASVPMGLFCDDTYAEVSAVIYSALATWGKIRALADNPGAKTVYTTFHPQEGSLRAKIRQTPKCDYMEHLLDGLYVLHNPFARFPIPSGLLSHPRIAEVRVAHDGELLMQAPDDFLLARSLWSVLDTERHGRGGVI